MKTATIIGAEKIESKRTLASFGTDDLVVEGPEEMSVSDGYHTFDELYDHRITLFIALCAAQRLFTDKEVWRSKRHSDGELCFGTGTQFVLGINTKAGEQITYHLPLDRWYATNFAVTLDKAPEFDGHTSDDVLHRLKQL